MVLGPDQVSAQAKQIGDSSMHGYESLSLPRGLEPSHPSLPYAGRPV